MNSNDSKLDFLREMGRFADHDGGEMRIHAQVTRDEPGNTDRLVVIGDHAFTLDQLYSIGTAIFEAGSAAIEAAR